MINSVTQEFNTVKRLVLHVLEHYPETRNSDNKLFMRSAECLGINKLADFEDMDLNLISVYKTRQHIQNKLGLFQPNDNVKENRKQRQKAVKEYMLAN